jgi:MYXO-CTERM domain-containing protein
MGTSVRGATTVDVPVATSSTPYDRFGDYVPVLSAVVLALLALARIRRRTEAH